MNRTEQLRCNFCGQYYTKSNKARHQKSSVCLAYQDAVNAVNEIFLEEDKQVKSFDDFVKKPFKGSDGKIIYLNNRQLKFLGKLK